MSDNLHYNSQKDKDMDERLAHPIEEKIVCKNCQAEYWESESHECVPIKEIDSGLDRLLAEADKITAVMYDANVSIDKLIKRNAVLEKALEICYHSRNMSEMKNTKTPFPNCYVVDYWLAKAEEQCKSK